MKYLPITKVFDDPNLFGGVLRDAETWAAWRGFLCALFGLPMSPAEASTLAACTGRATAPLSHSFRFNLFLEGA
jgi:hypothetical protein